MMKPFQHLSLVAMSLVLGASAAGCALTPESADASDPEPEAVAEASEALTAPINLYRLRYGGSYYRDHFYTESVSEVNAAIGIGFKYEGILGQCWPAGTAGTTPLYRLYSAKHHDHFYTTDQIEASLAVSNEGYTWERSPCNVFTQQVAGSCPIYRDWYHAPDCWDHFYTLSSTEASSASNYTREGVAGFVVPVNVSPGTCPN